MEELPTLDKINQEMTERREGILVKCLVQNMTQIYKIEGQKFLLEKNDVVALLLYYKML